MMKRTALAAFTIAAAALATPVTAAPVTYTSQALFTSSATVTTETFDSIPNTFYPSHALIAPTGVVVSDSDFLAVFNAGAVQINPSFGQVVIGDTSSSGFTSITLPNTTLTAASFNLGLYAGVGQVAVVGTTLLGNSFGAIVDYDGTGNLAFFGVTTDAGDYITSLSASPITGGKYLVLDNVSFGDSTITPVPEPASIAMLCLGLVGAGIPAFRRYRKVNA